MLSYLQYFEVIKYKLDDKYLYEMANLQPNETGLKPVIHIMFASGRVKHGPRVKVSNIAGTFSDDNFSLTLEQEPRVIGDCKIASNHLEDIKDWVKLNRDFLIHVWKFGGQMNSSDITHGIKRI